jgi:membrane protease YdiL (CAAX protease family)
MQLNASGFQIAFLVFAIALLAYPAQKYLGPVLGLEDPGRIVRRLFVFVPMTALLVLVPAFRRFAVDQLRRGIPSGRRIESGIAALAQIALPFAIGGATVLWYWTIGGEMALARRLSDQRSIAAELAQASSVEGFLFSVLLAGVVAPIVEELIFRGLLYRAWEAQWGWFWSMLATSAVFALYHPVPFAAFIGSVILVTVLRRTGSLWAPILVHAAGNIALWPVAMGRFYFQTAGKETGEIALWPFHLAALAVLAIALPEYVWLARDPGAAEIPEEEAAASRC